ncbi:MAG: YraN family protein [Tannerellaceae bacterium]|jgi:putative endonuclease|nr:YraN family protein [Tannerellaceae bacterium]
MAEQNFTGKEGEEEARNYLLKQEYTILHANWHWQHYEIDIIATKDDELVVVEVKTRSKNHLLLPEESVDREKIRRIVTAADVYIRRFRLDIPVRFDIITLIKRENGYTIEHIEDAFHAPMQGRW